MEITKLKKIIRESGLKCTSTRIAVLGYLVKVHRPVSTLEIIDNLKTVSINEVTVYRILESFVEKRIINQVDHWDRHRLYEAHLEENCQINHAHFSCHICKTVLCLEENTLQVSAITLPPGFQLGEVRLQVEGVCPTCSPA